MKKPSSKEPRCAVCNSRPIVETDKYGYHSCDTCGLYYEETEHTVKVMGRRLAFVGGEKLIAEIPKQKK